MPLRCVFAHVITATPPNWMAVGEIDGKTGFCIPSVSLDLKAWHSRKQGLGRRDPWTTFVFLEVKSECPPICCTGVTADTGAGADSSHSDAPPPNLMQREGEEEGEN